MQKRFKYQILPAVLALAVMAGAGIESLGRPRAADAEAYHAAVRASQARIPLDFGSWKSQPVAADKSITEQVSSLLHPNVMFERIFTDDTRGLRARVLLVAPKDARDMASHYPANCYPRAGYEQVIKPAPKLEWRVGEGKSQRTITGCEYLFTKPDPRNPLATVTFFVDSLLLVPGKGFVNGIDEIHNAASDYLRQYYGAAQIQVVLDSSMPPEMRRVVFAELMEAYMPMIDALLTIDQKPQMLAKEAK